MLVDCPKDFQCVGVVVSLFVTAAELYVVQRFVLSFGDVKREDVVRDQVLVDEI